MSGGDIPNTSTLQFTLDVTNKYIDINYETGYKEKYLLKQTTIYKINNTNTAFTDTLEDFIITDGHLSSRLKYTNCTNIIKNDLDDFIEAFENMISDKVLDGKNYLQIIGEGNVKDRKMFTIGGRIDNITIGNNGNIWTGGITYIPPTTERIHKLVSDSEDDIGITVVGATATGGTYESLIDTNATFISSGVTVGDLCINLSKGVHATCREIQSETTLLLTKLRDDIENLNLTLNVSFEEDDEYLIARAISTGGGIVKLEHCLDKDFNLAGPSNGDEYLITNGTTGVYTTSPYMRINRMSVIHTGSSRENVGKMILEAETDLTITQEILKGELVSKNAYFTSYENIVCYFVNINGMIEKSSFGTAKARINIIKSENSYIGNAPIFGIDSILMNSDSDPNYILPMNGGLQIPEKTDLYLTVDNISSLCDIGVKLNIVIANVTE